MCALSLAGGTFLAQPSGRKWARLIASWPVSLKAKTAYSGSAAVKYFQEKPRMHLRNSLQMEERLGKVGKIQSGETRYLAWKTKSTQLFSGRGSLPRLHVSR